MPEQRDIHKKWEDYTPIEKAIDAFECEKYGDGITDSDYEKACEVLRTADLEIGTLKAAKSRITELEAKLDGLREALEEIRGRYKLAVEHCEEEDVSVMGMIRLNDIDVIAKQALKREE